MIKQKSALFTKLTICVSIFLLSLFSLNAQAEASVDSSDIEVILNWWQGDYDNEAQIAALKADGAPIWQKDVEGQTLGGHLPVVAHYRKVEMALFGESVLYVEEKTFGEDGNPYRQRLYTLDFDEETKALSVKLWSFKDKEKYADAWKDLSMIKNLTKEEMSPLPDQCDLIVSKTADKRYYMKMSGCVFGTKLFDYQVSLGENDYWFRDRIANSETGVVETSAGGFTYHKLDKK